MLRLDGGGTLERVNRLVPKALGRQGISKVVERRRVMRVEENRVLQDRDRLVKAALTGKDPAQDVAVLDDVRPGCHCSLDEVHRFLGAAATEHRQAEQFHRLGIGGRACLYLRAERLALVQATGLEILVRARFDIDVQT